MHAESDVLVIGSGAAGMYAAVEAARLGCSVLLADRSLMGPGGATVTLAEQLGSSSALHRPR
jgi:succinate dehydrogenase flavoprotein subunit